MWDLPRPVIEPVSPALAGGFLITAPAGKSNMDVYSSFIHNDQNLEATKMSFNRWMDKQIVVHSYDGILLSTKKKGTIKLQKDMEKP